jgi:hypothetical protein
MSDNILDTLNSEDRVAIKDILDVDIETISHIPKKCGECKNSVICSILPTVISISRIGILLEVETCQFKPTK